MVVMEPLTEYSSRICFINLHSTIITHLLSQLKNYNKYKVINNHVYCYNWIFLILFVNISLN